MKKRSIICFEQGIKARPTLNNYRDHLKHFKLFAKFENFDSLISKPVEEIQTMVEDYLIYLKENRHPNSVPILMLGVRHFFILYCVYDSNQTRVQFSYYNLLLFLNFIGTRVKMRSDIFLISL